MEWEKRSREHPDRLWASSYQECGGCGSRPRSAGGGAGADGGEPEAAEPGEDGLHLSYLHEIAEELTPEGVNEPAPTATAARMASLLVPAAWAGERQRRREELRLRREHRRQSRIRARQARKGLDSLRFE